MLSRIGSEQRDAELSLSRMTYLPDSIERSPEELHQRRERQRRNRFVSGDRRMDSFDILMSQMQKREDAKTQVNQPALSSLFREGDANTKNI